MCHVMWHATSAREPERELTREPNSISHRLKGLYELAPGSKDQMKVSRVFMNWLQDRRIR